jgi:hypothetical protein
MTTCKIYIYIKELSAHKVKWEVNLLFIWKRKNLLLESSQVSTKLHSLDDALFVVQDL